MSGSFDRMQGFFLAQMPVDAPFLKGACCGKLQCVVRCVKGVVVHGGVEGV